MRPPIIQRFLVGAVFCPLLLNSPAAASAAGPDSQVAPPTAQNGNVAAGLELDLRASIALAFRNGLRPQLAAEDVLQATAHADAARSKLLPHLSVTGSQYRRTRNLKAMGFDFPGAPSFIGPFDSFDARIKLSQSLFDASARRGLKGAAAGEDAAVARFRQAREEIATVTAHQYINAIAARHAVKSAQANLDLANSLLQLAEDQKKAGIATGVDVARANTGVARRHEELIVAQANASETIVQLRRTIGVAQDRPLVLTDDLGYPDETPPQLDVALKGALEHRPEVTAARKAVEQFSYKRDATRAKRLPTVDFVAGYGPSGITPVNESRSTYSFGVEFKVPLFSSGEQNAAERIAASQERKAQLRLDDIKQAIEGDVRLALVRLNASAARVEAARQARTLAERESQLARDRFKHGLTDTVGVVSADAARAETRTDAIDAVAAYEGARVDLALALGHATDFDLQDSAYEGRQ